MRLLLDTCTFLWLAMDSPELSTRARQLFQSADNEAYLSSVSVWEIVLKHSLGRLSLSDPPERLIPDLRRRLLVEPLSLDEESALQLTRLPQLHRDPFDRMLVCQAIVHGMTILSPDDDIRQYPARVDW